MKNLKRLRRYLDLTQSEFAKILNVSRTTVTMWETEQREPDYSTVMNISEKFSVSADYVIGNGIFKNWEEIIAKLESIFYQLRTLIPADFKAFGDDRFLLAKLDILFFYEYDEVALARWFSTSIERICFLESAQPKIVFTPEFQAALRLFNDDQGANKTVPATISKQDGLSDESLAIARAYERAEQRDQLLVRTILSVADVKMELPLVARGGETVTPAHPVDQKALDRAVEASEEAAEKENAKF